MWESAGEGFRKIRSSFFGVPVRRMIVLWGLCCSYMVVSQNRGPQYGPQNTILLIMGTPRKVSLILGNPISGNYQAFSASEIATSSRSMLCQLKAQLLRASG